MAGLPTVIVLDPLEPDTDVDKENDTEPDTVLMFAAERVTVLPLIPLIMAFAPIPFPETVWPI